MPDAVKRDAGAQRWVADNYPRLHLAIYRSASGLLHGASTLREYIQRLRLQGPEAPAPDYPRDTAKKDLKRSFGLLRFLAENGFETLLEQIEHGLQADVIKDDMEVVSLLDTPTMRWVQYDAHAAMDLLVLVPATGRLASFSSSKVQGDPMQATGTVERFRLGNVHYYPFFNRMKPVTHRRVDHVKLASEADYVAAIAELKPLLKPLRHARALGLSRHPSNFVILGTGEGLALWSFAACIVRVEDIREVHAAGAGLLSQVNVTLSDGVDSCPARLDPGVFKAGLDEAKRLGQKSYARNLRELGAWQGWSLVVIGWPFGNEYRGTDAKIPHIVKWWPLGNSPELEVYRALAYVVSARKMYLEDFGPKNLDAQPLQGRRDIVEHDGALHYVPGAVDPRFFRFFVENGCTMPAPQRTMTQRFSAADHARQNGLLGRYLAANPYDLPLYRSHDPEQRLFRTFRSS